METNQFPFISPRQQEPTGPGPAISPRPTRQGPTDPQEVETFLDKFFTGEMPVEHVPGAVVALVKDGQLFFTKGYGYANVEKQIPIAPDRTLFRVASISKLFTDTAVMQLYERGLLNLNEDVNQYLKRFQIKNLYSQPITAANLMTQTDGTSQRLLGIVAPTASRMTPLGEFIPKYMPPFVQPPGKLYNYSNLGITLAGYLVEVISGVPFVQYIDQNILQPLNMSRSSFLQPLPPPLGSDLAVGYQYKSGNFQPVPFLNLNIAPAAALSVTATDIAHFMIAHLQYGRYETSRILKPDTAQLMHRQHFTHHPKLPGTAYGFHEYLENNLRAIGHTGNMFGYSSALLLLPEQNLGLFTVCNRYKPELPKKLLTAFFDHYYQVSEKPLPTKSPANFQDQAKRFTGTYRDLEYPRDTFTKLTAPLGHLHVKASRDGTLMVQTPGLFSQSRVKRQLVPVEPLLFQQTHGGGYTAFGEDSRGRIAYMFNPINSVIGAFEKIPWYETAVFQLGLVGFCLVLFLSACVVWPVGYLIRGSRKQHFSHPRPAQARLTAGLVSALYLVFLTMTPLALWLIGAWKLAYGVPAVVIPLFYLPPIAAGLTIALPVFTVLVWKNKSWSTINRVHYSLVTLAAIAFIPFLLYWNLLGSPFQSGRKS